MLAGNRLSELVKGADFDQLMSISASARGSFGDFAAFGDLLTSPGAEKLFTNKIFGAALVDDKIADFIRGDLFAELISNGDLLSQVQEGIQAR